MHALAWAGIVLLALGILAYLVLKLTIWVAAILFIIGVVLIVWGATKVKRVV
ncbi:MAG TPA: hypothetical protein VJU87_12205 [Gemmatimonadaceae bacterium]|nr:hypothetical protein [Gemmatimonadaceae bacterium]